MINPLIEKYSYLEKSDHPSKMVDYLKMWKALQESEVAPTTFVNKVLILSKKGSQKAQNTT